MNEMNKLEQYLKNHGYEYKRYHIEIMGETLAVYDDGNYLWDVSYTINTAGYKQGLVSGFGVLFDAIEENLTADEVISRLEALDG